MWVNILLFGYIKILNLKASNVQLNLSKDSPEQIIITLEKITKDRSNWRIKIRDAVDGTHPKVL